MRWGVRIAAGICIGTCAVACGLAGAATFATPVLTSVGKEVQATQGSYCQPGLPATPGGPASVGCADYAYPLRVSCLLPARPGAPITIRTAVADQALSAFLLDGRGHRIRSLRPVPGADQTWSVRLPKKLKGAAVIDVFERFYSTNGDSDTWTGLKTGACRAAKFGR